MNPNDIPIKFPLHTRVRVIKGFNAGMRGSIIEERRDGKNNHVSFDGGGDAWFSDHELEALPVPEVGDLVRVTKFGRWQAQEGNVTAKDKFGMLTVDLEFDWNEPIFEPRYLEVVEKVKPLPEKPVRIEGKPIKPEDVKRGDKISVVTVEADEIKRTTILEAVVDKIINKGWHNGTLVELQTRTGKKIFNNEHLSDAVISLVADIDKDSDFAALSEIKPNEIIGFPDEEGGAEINIAVKKAYGDHWHILLGEKSAKSGTTVGLVNLLRKRNVTFSVIRKVPNPLEFPKGTIVKVNPKYSDSLSTGDYRVIIEGVEESVIKSVGISANTFTVPNRWLTKG